MHSAQHSRTSSRGIHDGDCSNANVTVQAMATPCRFLGKGGDAREQGSRKDLIIKSETASCPVSYPKLSIKVCHLVHHLPVGANH